MEAIRFMMFLGVLSLPTYAPPNAASQIQCGVQITPKPSPCPGNRYMQSCAVLIGLNAYEWNSA